MAKSKKKKKKDADFQKVKLKVGKAKLSKGNNITNLSFKTRQIQLTQTIRDGEGVELVTKKNHTIPDLLRQCEHKNRTMRVNAVAGLKQLWLNNHSELMSPSNRYGYGTILQKISTMFSDDEADVRQAVISLFKTMVTKLAKSSSPPVGFPTLHIHTYLSCALSHVHEDIKLDALLIFDVLLDAMPHMLINQTGDLLNNLLGFISSPINIGSRGDSTTQKLSMNPDSKLPVMEFRAKVLSRLKRLFQVAVDSYLKRQEPEKSKNEHTWSLHCDHMGENTRQDTVVMHSQNRNRFKIMFSGVCHEADSHLSKPSTLEHFVTDSITVLLHCWREARACVDGHGVWAPGSRARSLVPKDSADVMYYVASIIQLAFALCGVKQKTNSGNRVGNLLVPGDVLVQSRAAEFENLFLTNFPYSIQIEKKSSSKKKKAHQESDNSTPQFTADDLNICLCDIMASFYTCPTFQMKSNNKCARIQDFIIQSLDSPSEDHCAMIARSLKNIVASSPTALRTFLPSFKQVLKYFLSQPVSSPQKRLLYPVFVDLCLAWDGNTSPLGQEKTLSHAWLAEKFLTELPDLLMDVLSEEHSVDTDWALDILGVMARAKGQRCRGFDGMFLEMLNEYLDLDTGLMVSATEAVTRQVFSIISLGTALTKQHYKHIVRCLRHDLGLVGQQQGQGQPMVDQGQYLVPRRASSSLLRYVIHCLSANIRELVPLTSQKEFNKMSSTQSALLSDYFSFMLSLQIGMLKETLNERFPVMNAEGLKASVCDVHSDIDAETWDRHVHIVECVVRELVSVHLPACPKQGYTETFGFTDSMAHLWLKTFAPRRGIHVMSVYSLLEYLKLVSPDVLNESPFLTFVSNMVVSTLVHIHTQDVQIERQVLWKFKETLMACLHRQYDMLLAIVDALDHIKQYPGNTQSCAMSISTAEDFLLSDVIIRHKIKKYRKNKNKK